MSTSDNNQVASVTLNVIVFVRHISNVIHVASKSHRQKSESSWIYNSWKRARLFVSSSCIIGQMWSVPGFSCAQLVAFHGSRLELGRTSLFFFLQNHALILHRETLIYHIWDMRILLFAQSIITCCTFLLSTQWNIIFYIINCCFFARLVITQTHCVING